MSKPSDMKKGDIWKFQNNKWELQIYLVVSDPQENEDGDGIHFTALHLYNVNRPSGIVDERCWWNDADEYWTKVA